MAMMVLSEEEGVQESSTALPRHTRRLSDKILVAFHHACDVSDFEIAEQLLRTLEVMLTRRPLPSGRQPPPQHGKPDRGA